MEPWLDFQDVLLMPQYSKIESRKEVDVTIEYKGIKQVPIIASNMDTVGTIAAAEVLATYGVDVALDKYIPVNDIITHLYKKNHINHSWVTIGIKDDDYAKLALINSFVPVKKICIDVANGHTQKFLDVCKKVRDKYPDAILMAGNIGNPSLIPYYSLIGIDIVKVGIGSGAVCLTRQVAGVGVPQYTLVNECSKISSTTLRVCSDGGITCPGDVCKALVAGAEFVMVGSEFAGCDENSPDGKIYGMSSKLANDRYHGGLSGYKSSEGREVQIKPKGPIANVIEHYLGGMRSCMAYVGAKNPWDIKTCAEVIQVNRQLNERLVYGQS